MHLTVRGETTLRPAPVYLLDAGSHVLRWGPGASQNCRASVTSEDFLRQVVARTGLPVRDVTALAYAIQRDSTSTRTMMWSSSLVVPYGSPEIHIPGLALALQPTENQRKRARLLKRIAWTPLLLFGLLYAAGALLALIQYTRLH
jgi:hypothetical protein